MTHTNEIPPGSPYRSIARSSPVEADGETLVEVVVSWGASDTLAVAHLRAGERFVLTSRGRTDPDAPGFVHPALARGDRTLVEHLGRDGLVTLPDGATATLTSSAAAPAPAGARFELPRGVCAHIEHGGVRYTVRHVPAAERLPAGRGDRLFGVAAALALGGTLAVGQWAHGLDRDDRLTRDDEAPQRWVTGAIDRERARSYAPTHSPPGVGVEGGTGLRALGDEGAAGLRRAPRVSRAWSRPPQRGPSREAAAPRDALALVRRRGVFSALGPAGASPWEALTPGDSDDRRASGAMYGAASGDAHGYEGLGLLGAGWGGGAQGEGLLGLGRVRTRGHGTEAGTWQGIGNGGACGCGEGALSGRATGYGDLRVRVVSASTSCSGPVGAPSGGGCVAVSGALLDPAAIRRVVQRNLGQVRHCYETALAQVPNAQGRVAVRWVIGASGVVLAATATDNDTGSVSLGACVADAVRRWQFPAPDEGGVVTVNYPFDLSVVDP